MQLEPLSRAGRRFGAMWSRWLLLWFFLGAADPDATVDAGEPEPRGEVQLSKAGVDTIFKELDKDHDGNLARCHAGSHQDEEAHKDLRERSLDGSMDIGVALEKAKFAAADVDKDGSLSPEEAGRAAPWVIRASSPGRWTRWNSGAKAAEFLDESLGPLGDGGDM
eukprot:Skav231076  [mRNA]  locus=scaffold524:321736:325226:+ [translate_table: standard]